MLLIDRSDWKELEESAEELLKRFAINNLKSGNFGSLVQIFLTRCGELQTSLEADGLDYTTSSFF